MDYQELAKELRENFTAFAWTCACEGKDPSCASVRNSVAEQVRYYYLDEIARWIENKG